MLKFESFISGFQMVFQRLLVYNVLNEHQILVLGYTVILIITANLLSY